MHTCTRKHMYSNSQKHTFAYRNTHSHIALNIGIYYTCTDTLIYKQAHIHLHTNM